MDISTMTQEVLCTFMYCIVKRKTCSKTRHLSLPVSWNQKVAFPHSQVQDLCTLEVQPRLVQQRFLSRKWRDCSFWSLLLSSWWQLAMAMGRKQQPQGWDAHADTEYDSKGSEQCKFDKLHAWHHPKSESSRKAKIGQDEANMSRTPNRSSCFGLKRSQ